MTNSIPIPTILISGYLGAGKTTLINHLLVENDGQRITVLVNDFGEIAVDADLIANKNGDTLALTNGCMCCSIGGALYDAIDRVLSANPKPDYLLIETSGVADPGKIAQIAIAEPDLEFVGCLTLVDAMNFREQQHRKYIGDTVERQVQKADAVGITKADTVSEEELKETISTIATLNGETNTITVKRGALPFRFLLDIFSPRQEGSSEALSLEHSHGDVYHSWSYEGETTCTVENIRNISKPAISGIYRLKGYVMAPEGGVFLVNRAGDDFQFEKVKSGPNCTRLVAIGVGTEFMPQSFQASWDATTSNSHNIEATVK